MAYLGDGNKLKQTILNEILSQKDSLISKLSLEFKDIFEKGIENGAKNLNPKIKLNLKLSENDFNTISKDISNKFKKSIDGAIKNSDGMSLKPKDTDIQNVENTISKLEKANKRLRDATESLNKQAEESTSKSTNKNNSRIKSTLETLALNRENIENRIIKEFYKKGKTDNYPEALSNIDDRIHNTFKGLNENSSSLLDIRRAKSELSELSKELNSLSRNSSFNILNTGGKNKGELLQDTIGKVDISNIKSQMLDYANSLKLGTLETVKFNEITKTLNTTFTDASGKSSKLTLSYDEQAKGIRQSIEESQKFKTTTENLNESTDKLRNGIVDSISKFVSMGQIISTIKTGFSYLKEYDSALTSIKFTMDLTKKGFDDLGQSMIKNARDTGSTVKDSMAVAQIYSNMQTSASEIAKLSVPTIYLANASGINTATASDQIQSVIQAFDLAENQAEHIVDVYEYISANLKLDYSKGIQSMAEATKIAGLVAKDAGLSFEQLSAIIGKSAEKTRLEGTQLANALKTIMVRTSKASKLSGNGEVDNETLSLASKSLKNVGIEVYNLDGSFREFDVIMGELATKWDKLSNAQQSNIAYNVAATRQTNVFKGILDSFSESMELATKATNINGVAQETQEKYMDSYSAKLNIIKTNSEAFWINMLNSKNTKGLLDIIGKITEGFANLTNVKGFNLSSSAIFGLTGGFFGVKHSMFEKFTSFTDEFNKTSKMVKTFNSSGLEGVTSQYGELTQAQLRYFQSATQGRASIGGLITQFSSLNSILAVGKDFLIGFGVTMALNLATQLVIRTVDKLIVTQKEAKEKAKESILQYEQAGSSIEKLNKEIDETKSKISALENKELSFVESGELEKLKSTNNELQTQLDLQKAIEKESKKGAVEDSKKYLNKKVSRTFSAGLVGSLKSDGYVDNDYNVTKEELLSPVDYDGNVSFNFTKIQALQYDLATLKNENLNLNNLYEKRNELSKKGEESSKEYLSLTKRIEESEKSRNKISSSIADDIKEYSSIIKILDDTDVDKIKFNNLQNDFVDLSNDGKVEKTKELFDNLIDRTLSKNEKERIILLRESKALNEDIINQYPSLVKGIESAGFSLKDFVNIYNQGFEKVQDSNNKVEEDFEKIMKSLIQESADYLKFYSTINSLISSSASGGSISIEDLNTSRLLEYSGALELIDGKYKLNIDTLKEWSKVKSETDLNIISNNKSKKIDEWSNLENEIEEYTKILNSSSTEEKQAIQDTIDGLKLKQEEIYKQVQIYDLMSYNIREATSSLKEWQDAMKGPESGDVYDSIPEILKTLSEGFDSGLTNTNRFKTAFDFIFPEGTGLDKAKESLKTLQSYYSGDGKGVLKFLSDSASFGLMSKDETGTFTILGEKSAKDFISAFIDHGIPMTEEALQAIFGKLSDYGANFNWTDDNLDSLITKYTTYIAQVNNLTEQINSGNLVGSNLENSKNRLDELNLSLDETKEKITNGVLDNISKINSLNAKIGIPGIDPTQKQKLIDELNEIVKPRQIELQIASEELSKRISSTTDPIEKQNLLNKQVIIKAELDKLPVDNSLKNLKDEASKENIQKKVTADINPLIEQVNIAKGVIEQSPILLKVKTDLLENQTSPQPNSILSSSNFTPKYNSKSGTAKALGGNIDSSRRVLVGELGRELVVDPDNGTWRTVGDNGVEFVNLPKNAIVFNHIQTNELLNRSSTGFRGLALASGSFDSRRVSGGASSSNINPNYSKNNKSKNKGSKKNSNKKEETREIFDWAERFLDTKEELLKSYEKIANEENKSYNLRQSNLKMALDLVKEEVADYDKLVEYRRQMYLKALKEATKTTGMSSEVLAQKVENGSLEEQDFGIDETGKKKKESVDKLISSYEKLQSAQNKSNEIEEKAEQLAKKSYELKLKQIDATVSAKSEEISAIQSEMKLLEATGEVVGEDFYEDMISKSKEQVDLYSKQLELSKERLASLDNESEEYDNVSAQVQKYSKQINEARIQQIEWQEAISDIPIKRVEKYLSILNNIKTDLKNHMSETLKDQNKASLEHYNYLVNITNSELQAYEKQQRLLSEKLSNYSYGSTKFDETSKKIQELDNNISSAVQSIKEWNTQILNIPINKITETNEKLNAIVQSISSVIGDYDTTIGAVTTLLSRESDDIKKQQDLVKKGYEDRIKPIQETISKLNEENEARKQQLDLEQARYNFEKTKNQKTVAVIRNGEKIYESDQKALRDSRTALDSTNKNKVLYDLNKQIKDLEKERDTKLETYDKELERLQKISEKWAEIKDNIAFIRESFKANEILGANWQDKVKSGNDLDLYNKVNNDYKIKDAQKYSYEQQIASNERIATLMKQYVEAFTNGQMSYEKTLEGLNSLSNSVSRGLSALQVLDKLQVFNGGEQFEKILSSLTGSLNSETSKYTEYMNTVNDNISSINSYTLTWNKMKEDLERQLRNLESDEWNGEKSERFRNGTEIKEYKSNNSRWHTGDVTHGPGIKLKKYHTGIANGYVGMGNVDKLALLQKLSLSPLSPDEVPAILKAKEVVLTENQQNNLLRNISITSALPTVQSKDMATNQDIKIEMNNMSVYEVDNGKDFADYISRNIAPTIKQVLSK